MFRHNLDEDLWPWMARLLNSGIGRRTLLVVRPEEWHQLEGKLGEAVQILRRIDEIHVALPWADDLSLTQQEVDCAVQQICAHMVRLGSKSEVTAPQQQWPVHLNERTLAYSVVTVCVG